MKVETKMINPQLRLRGRIIKFLLNAMGEKEFIRNEKIIRGLLQNMQLKDMKNQTAFITRKDGTGLRVRIYRPLNQNNDATAVLWIHGGGYAMGVPELSGGTYRELIKASNCVIVAPDYRLTVEKPYPAALHDCYLTLLWMKKNAEKLGIRSNQIMVGGESAGGALAAAVCLYARDRKEVNIAFQMPLYPMIDDRMVTESATDNNAPFWDSVSNHSAWQLHLGKLFNTDNIPCYAAPARADDCSNLPPAVTFVGDLEPFRDETIAFVSRLRDAGVPVDFEMYKGCFHAFDMLHPKADISQKAIQTFIRSYLYAVDHYFAEQDS